MTCGVTYVGNDIAILTFNKCKNGIDILTFHKCKNKYVVLRV